MELSRAGSFPPLRQDPMLCEREAPWSSGGGRHVSSPVGREVCVLLLDLPGRSSRSQGLPSHRCRDTAAYLSGPLPVPPVLAPSSVPLNAACPLSSVWLLTFLSLGLGKVVRLLSLRGRCSCMWKTCLLFSFSIQEVFIQSLPCATFTWDPSVM